MGMEATMAIPPMRSDDTTEYHGRWNAEYGVPSPDRLSLPEREIQVWRVSLEAEQGLLGHYQSLLSSGEQARADRFLVRPERNRFVITRAILRKLLAAYLGCSPSTLEFESNPNGKPFLRAKRLKRSMQFNVSHSHGLALLAFSWGRKVGIDLEFVQPAYATGELARQWFSRQEAEESDVLPASSRAERFFVGWTQTEAWAKARGEGLRFAGRQPQVYLEPETFLISDSSQWCLHSLRPAPSYVGALVGEGQDWSPRFLCWKSYATVGEGWSPDSASEN